MGVVREFEGEWIDPKVIPKQQVGGEGIVQSVS